MCSFQLWCSSYFGEPKASCFFDDTKRINVPTTLEAQSRCSFGSKRKWWQFFNAFIEHLRWSGLVDSWPNCFLIESCTMWKQINIVHNQQTVRCCTSLFVQEQSWFENIYQFDSFKSFIINILVQHVCQQSWKSSWSNKKFERIVRSCPQSVEQCCTTFECATAYESPAIVRSTTKIHTQRLFVCQTQNVHA